MDSPAAHDNAPAPAAMLAVAVGALALNQLVNSFAWNVLPAAVVILLGVGLGYRFTAGGEWYSSAATNARGATGSFTIRFGKL